MTIAITRRAALTVSGAAALMPLSTLTTHGNTVEAATHTIEIRKFKFEPSSLTVRPGDTVTWVNRDIVPHTATASDKSWDTGKLKRGESISVNITKGQTEAYYCRFHPNMKAVLNLSVDGGS